MMGVQILPQRFTQWRRVLPNALRFAVGHWGFRELVRRVIRTWKQGGMPLLRQKLRSGVAFMAHSQSNVGFALSPLPAPESQAMPSQLGLCYQLPEPEWNHFLGPLFTEKLIRPSHRLTPRADVWPRLWVVLDLDRQPGAACADMPLDMRVERSLAAVGRLSLAAEFPVSCVAGGGDGTAGPGCADVPVHATVADAVAQAGDDDLLLFLAPGDEVRTELALAVPVFRLFDRALTLVDLYYRERDAVYPVFLPGLNHCHALACDYFRSRFLARGREVKAAGGFATPRDLALSLIGDAYVREDWETAIHVPLPLVCIDESGDAVRREREALVRCTGPVRLPHAQAPGFFDAASVRAGDLGSVSVVLCTKDKGLLLRQAVDALLRYPAELVREVVVVSNQTTNEYALTMLDELRRNPRVSVIPFDQPFNFSRQCNLGTRETTGDFLLFLNDDIVPVTPDWLEELMLPFVNPRVGITGPLLVYPDERVQQSGMYLGFNNVAGHTLRFARLPDQDYGFLASAPRFVTVLTGAALLMRRELFETVNGFDPLFASYIQDVDLCLRAHVVGADLVFNPRSILIHMESVSVKTLLPDPLIQSARGREFEIFHSRWSGLLTRDPFHNENFSRADESLRTLRA